MTRPSTEGTDRPGFPLGRFLLDNGCLTRDWAGSFEAVPRSLFLPDLMWAHDMATGRSTALNRYEEPAAWRRAALANVPIVTQWDDGEHTGTAPGSVPTSSASMPSVVASMLRDLDVKPGMRVLEVGTGTGWNAGLLAHRLGGDHVVSVEVDAAVAARARAALDRAGLHPEVVVADGREGWPPGAPYDRLIATCGIREVPAPWLEQVRPGGLILAPWGTHYANQDAVLRLTVAADGTASGRFTELVEFMKLRAHRLQWPRHAEYAPEFPGGADISLATTLELDDLGGTFDAATFVTGLAVSDCAHLVHRQNEETTTAWFYGLTDRSWAAVVFRGKEPAIVYQSGARRLASAVERAMRWWNGRGRPGLPRFGVTVTPTGQQIPWLDEPGSPVPRQV
ncbi:methyltransferase domain-containing protein [Allostreptomyces psammosilenae]|uniref:Protein-L-isoaspartate O-methyltransferase n=1 Tax=Allostreptomyces psammosilenae TaxID=1892865 RepID=A0A853A393_9ACTN|nr:methyltransferase domain-containing protein [Allostreptomyces psammosilenae]NYI07940.1 protein-L-isoaspartate(D-aspartate) O-methyltransferase [Allostreptomyces psammosilenae]